MTSSAPPLLLVFPLFAALLGLVLGSFYTVCVHRYISEESIVWPGSHCPACGHPLAWWENIPLFSFLFLRGRCRTCKARIPLRYVIIEAVSGLLALILALRFGPGLPWLVYMLFGGIYITASFIDWELFILPDRLTLPAIPLAVLAAVFGLGMPWTTSVIGGAVGAGGFWFIQLAYRVLRKREGMGTGDIKLMASIGALIGWPLLPIAVFLSALSALAASVVFLRRPDADGLRTQVPFGPFLCLGAMTAALFGRDIMLWLL